MCDRIAPLIFATGDVTALELVEWELTPCESGAEHHKGAAAAACRACGAMKRARTFETWHLKTDLACSRVRPENVSCGNSDPKHSG